MGYFKFDKLDKIVISFTLIIVTLFCVFNSFCFASENVNDELVVLNNLMPIDGKIITTTSSVQGAYLKTDFNERYLVINNRSSGSLTVVLTKQLPGENVEYYNRYVINSNSELYIDINNSNYNYIYITSFIPQSTDLLRFLDIYKTNINGLSGTINLLTDKVSFDIWNVFKNSIPFVLVVVIFSLGFWFIKHNIIEHSKGREY